MNELQRDKIWSDARLKAVVSILEAQFPNCGIAYRDGRRGYPRHIILISKSDTFQFGSIRKNHLEILFRIRDKYYQGKYPDFTLRSYRKNASNPRACEYQKVMGGFGDYLFYAVSTYENSDDLNEWHLVDLHKFRAVSEKGDYPSHEIPNRDGTTMFMACPIIPSIVHVAHTDSDTDEVPPNESPDFGGQMTLF